MQLLPAQDHSVSWGCSADVPDKDLSLQFSCAALLAKEQALLSLSTDFILHNLRRNVGREGTAPGPYAQMLI